MLVRPRSGHRPQVHPDEPSKLAETGVVLYLEDLKEVSQQTNDAVKYVCSHKVLDSRVEIISVLNQAESKTRETYLRRADSDESRRRRGRTWIVRGRVAAPPRPRRGHSEDGPRRRHGCDVDIPWRRVSAPPQPRRGSTFETSAARTK